MKVVKLNSRQGQEYRIPRNFHVIRTLDMGVTMGGEISDELYSYLVESSKINAEVVLTVKVVG